MTSLKQFLYEYRKLKHITLFFDIETFQYNEKAGKEKPSLFKNMTYSVAVSWLIKDQVEVEIFSNFKDLFDTINSVFSGLKKKPIIELNAHNTNKYDSHFLRYDLIYFYPFMKDENFFLNTATTGKTNEESLRIKDLTKEDKQGIILEKRIKSSNNLELTFFLYGIKFFVTDNWVKTNSSIDMLGKKMLRLGVISEDELKTDFDYLKYNKQEDLTDEQAREYAQEIFESLNEEQLTYIRNDVIILAKSVYYYSQIFKDFDYSKRTFTSNILESYNTNDLTSFQLLNRVGEKKDKIEIRYTDYTFNGQNFYDYLKPFYRGGLNFYNQFFIGKIIKSGVFAIDINSSYPYAMHHFKIPTFLEYYSAYSKETEVSIEYDDNFYSLYQLSKETFDNIILSNIKSVLFKQILVKYYNTNETINLNTYTFRMIEKVTGMKYESIPVLSKVTFSTQYFGSREKIEEFYQIKTEGKSKKKLIFNSPYDIQETNEINEVIFSQEEVDNSKVNLNGLYGIPALRPYFNVFRMDKNKEFVNIENGHKNAERNIVFSIFVTSVSLWNLLSPLQYLTQEEIDENLLYCDTDSLYLKTAIRNKIPTDFYHDKHLGKWDIQNNYIDKFFVLNHKKYAYEEKGKIKVRSGGISKKSFDFNMSFEEFIKTQFSENVEIKNTKSIMNAQGTISIYPSVTKLEMGKGYFICSQNPFADKIKETMFKEIKENVNLFKDDVLYIESVIGTYSIADIFDVSHETKHKDRLAYLQIKQDKIRKRIGWKSYERD